MNLNELAPKERLSRWAWIFIVSPFFTSAWASQTQFRWDRFSKEMGYEIGINLFGYSNCLVSCSASLQKMTLVWSRLPRDLQKRARIVFVGIDPQPSTSESLKKFVERISPKAFSLQLNSSDLSQVLAEWKTNAQPQKNPQDPRELPVYNHSKVFVLSQPQRDRWQSFSIESPSKQIEEEIRHTIEAWSH